MQRLPTFNWRRFALVVLAGLGFAQNAKAEILPPPVPPPSNYWPSPGYPPPAYGQPQFPQSPSLPPAGYAPPAELPYESGEPIPVGYRLVEEPRRGLVNAGYILTGIAYGLGLMIALAAEFDNSSGYMAVPFAGPWLTLGRRQHAKCSDASGVGEGLHCAGDVFVVMGLIVDGTVQAIGGSLLFSGYMATQTKLVRKDLTWWVGPRQMGSGYGLAARTLF